MRIAFFTNAYKPITSGVVVHIEHLRKALQRQGHQVYVFAPEYHDYVDADEGIYRFKSMDLTQKVDFPVAVPYTAGAMEVLREFRPDLIHVHHPFVMGPAGARCAKKLDIPTLFTFHTDYQLYTDLIPFPELWVKTAANRLVRDFCNKMTCVVTPAESKRRQLLSIGVERPIHVIPNAVDAAAYARVDEEETEALRRQYYLRGQRVLLYVGRLSAEKNLPFLLEAYKLILRQDGHCRLLLVGGGPQEEELRDKVRQMGLTDRVTFTGNVEYDRLPAYYRLADAFLFASRNESCPLAVLEAMAAGLPIMALDAPWARDLLRHGENALLLPNDLQQYTEAVLELFAHPQVREQLRQGALATAPQYSVERIADRITAIYEAVRRTYEAQDRAE